MYVFHRQIDADNDGIKVIDFLVYKISTRSRARCLAFVRVIYCSCYFISVIFSLKCICLTFVIFWSVFVILVILTFCFVMIFLSTCLEWN